MANTRLKDYLDLSVLLARENLDPTTLATAIAATFRRRGTALPADLPIRLSDDFSLDATRMALWRAFLKKNELTPKAPAGVVAALRAALGPALTLARTQ